MKPDKHLFTAAGALIAAASLIVLTWVGTTRAIDAQRIETADRVTAALSAQALAFSEQINRQILAIDQTLRALVASWEANPRAFELETARVRSVALSGLSRDMVMTDETGTIRQSSVVDAINQNASGLDYFRVLAASPDAGDGLYIGPAAIDGIMRQWHLNIARAMQYPDGSFAGVLDTDYRIAAITDVFREANLGPNAFLALAGLDDGKLRGAVSATTIDPDASIGDTAMFAGIQASDSGVWTGPSANDAVTRIHAFRRVPGRKLAVIVAMDEAEALRPATEFRFQAQVLAGCISLLLTVVALLTVQGTRMVRRRDAASAEDRALLAASNAQFEVARAQAAAKAEQLEATLAGMTAGVSIIDAHMCLVEWNARFPEIAGVPAEVLRVGLPMEEILRAQIRSGQFGVIRDPEAEVERRMARLRTARLGVVQRPRPDGRILELRRNRLPDGGYVTLYTDVTEQKRADEALRKARTEADTAKDEKARFVAIAGQEIRRPVIALRAAIQSLNDSVLTSDQQSLVATARQSADVLLEVTSDILDVSAMEAGTLSIHPSLFELQPLLSSCADFIRTQGAPRGIKVWVSVAEDTPETLLTDAARLRQVQLALLSTAMRSARAGNIWLTAEPGRDSDEAIRLSVRDDGAVIPPDARAGLFRRFSKYDRMEGDDPTGTGLGLSVCHDLVALMRGKIGYDIWKAEDGREGNMFWVTLPPSVLPVRPAGPGAPTDTSRADKGISLTELPRRPLPRTRVLLTEDVPANQLITATLLRRQGHLVDIAASGAAAVLAMKTTPYDLVFMDIFMPGMSGQEATQIIRDLPEPAGSTPVVALTANVSPDDETAFRAAGMDGVLRKPVSPSELLGALRTYVWAARSSPQSDAAATDDALDKAFPTALSADRIGELRANLPPDTFETLIQECLVDMDHRLPALRRALQAQAPGAITAHAHALVGMAAGYGMVRLEARLRLVMNASRDSNLAALETTIVADIERDFAEAAQALRHLLRPELA